MDKKGYEIAHSSQRNPKYTYTTLEGLVVNVDSI
jgi:hypothetical protein